MCIRDSYFAVPVTAAPRRGPNGKTPALFGYFLNIKKVTPSADFVISPAKAGAFLFFHTRLPFPPPFPTPSPGPSLRRAPRRPARAFPRRANRPARHCPQAPYRAAPPPGAMCSLPRQAPLAVAPRSHPGACSRSVAFRLRRNRAAGHRPHRGRCFAVPVTAPPRRVPNGKTPALAPVRSHFACGETARPVVAPAGGNVLATPFSLRSNVAPHFPCLLYTSRFTIVPGKSAEITAARFRRGRNATEREQAPGFCRWGPGAAEP